MGSSPPQPVSSSAIAITAIQRRRGTDTSKREGQSRDYFIVALLEARVKVEVSSARQVAGLTFQSAGAQPRKRGGTFSLHCFLSGLSWQAQNGTLDPPFYNESS